MKRVNLQVIALVLLLFLCWNSPMHAEDDLEWEQHGYIRYSLGYNWVDGDNQHLTPGLNYTDYSINVSGNMYKDENDFEYSFTADPGVTADIQFFWDNPMLSARYDQGIKVNFDELQLAFNKSQVDGFQLKSANNGLTLFQGKESYIPLSRSFFVSTPGRNEFSLLDNASAGDIVEHSEVVILDGEVLTGGRDYSLNVLSGKLLMYVPLEWGMSLEVKFLYIVVNEEFSPKGENLLGAVFSHKWLDNHLGLFYFKRGDDVNQVIGTTGQYSWGPLRLRGEWALSKAQEEEVANAYEMESNYTDENLNVSYQIRNVDPEFQEIGVVPFIKGKSSSFEMKFQVEPNLLWALQLNHYVYDDGWVRSTSNQKKAMVDYTVNPSQSVQFIFEGKERNLSEETLENMDFSLGYTVKTKPLTVNLGQSLQDADKRFAKVWIDYAPFRINGSYNVENLWDGKEHQAKAEISYRPFSRLDLTSYTEFRKRFDAEKPNWRIYMNGNWIPSQPWSINGGYLYFNNPKYEAYNQRFNSMINYSTSRFNSNVNITKTRNESMTGKVDDLDLLWSTNMIFWKDYQLNYQLTTNDFLEYNKYAGMINFKQKDRFHSLGLDYVWRDFYVFSTRIGLSKTGMGGEGYMSETRSRSLGLGLSYQKDLKHQYSIDVGIEKKGEGLALTFDSRLLHPIGPFKVDYAGKVGYAADEKVLTKSLFTYAIIFPNVWKLTPSVRFQSDFTNAEQAQRIRQAGAKIEYQWKEKQLIFLEAKGEQFVNWKKVTENYNSIGIFSGIQIDY